MCVEERIEKKKQEFLAQTFALCCALERESRERERERARERASERDRVSFDFILGLLYSTYRDIDELHGGGDDFLGLVYFGQHIQTRVRNLQGLVGVELGLRA